MAVMIALMIVVLAACQDEKMAGKIARDEVTIVADQDDHRYAVAHYAGNLYTVKPIK